MEFRETKKGPNMENHEFITSKEKSRIYIKEIATNSISMVKYTAM